ncbi:MAG: Asp-tRNA(Asn)/Glu-tRNA(Gln) amidotransferase subunit GatC [Acetivibrionales bacterium]|jgi:aspartyl-tRNA(Asn)/glutamyl-tRNA(Gln) amidotransferase subunit C
MVDIDTVRKIADLAAIHIDENELEDYAAELDAVIKYMGEIKNLDTNDAKAMEHILHISNVFREDNANNRNIRSELISKAAVSENGYYKVPAVVELS